MDRRRVLLVEDDPEVAGFLRDLLESRGYRLRHASNGAEALSALACSNECGYDVVLLDWNLAFFPGGKLLSLIRGESRIPELPVVVLTGSVRPEDRELALGLGVSAFLNKPSSAGEILAALERAIAESEHSSSQLSREALAGGILSPAE